MNDTRYLCTPGRQHSLTPTSRDIEPADLPQLAKLDLAVATPAHKYRKTVQCPVNGDGYYYTRQAYTDPSGFVVGSVEVDGPRGEL